MLIKFQDADSEKNRLKRNAFFFVMFMIAFESFVLNIGYSEYTIFLYDTQKFWDILVILIFILFSHYIFYRFVLASFSSGWILKVFSFTLFSISLLTEYGCQKALGRFSGSNDYKNVVATTSDQKIEQFILYFDYYVLIPSIIFLVCLIFIKYKDESKSSWTLVNAFILLFAFFGGLSYLSDLFIEKKFPIVSMNAFFRTNSDYLIWGTISGDFLNINGGPKLRRQVIQPNLPENFVPNNNIVFVVDESAMGSHFSINGYSRPTTPFLEQLEAKGVLLNWKITAAASTCSLFSYNALITGLTPDDLPDKTNFKVQNFPTIFQYAKAMGYKTYFIDGQMKNYWGGIEDDKNFVDYWIGSDETSKKHSIETWEIDNNIAQRVNKIISANKGNFIFVFKRGSHVPYQKNFPPNQQTWSPSYNMDDNFTIPDVSQLKSVENSYDNSLKYNVNFFFKNLVDDYAHIPNNSLIIYTGDHGQTLFIDGKASHGGKSKAEATVPLFIIGYKGKKVDTSFKASHANILPTLLDLMNFPLELRDNKNSISLFEATQANSKPRFFNPDLEARVPFD
jgi:glucan phosphoethanolaminetransferase (alkaline phosphatase superfamily)